MEQSLIFVTRVTNLSQRAARVSFISRNLCVLAPSVFPTPRISTLSRVVRCQERNFETCKNQQLLRFSKSRVCFSTVSSPLPTEDDQEPVVRISESCAKRLKELQSEEPNGKVMLRVAVEGGGCSGFQYTFSLDHAVNEDDRIFEKDGAEVVVDETSLEYLKGSTVDWTEELIRSAFRVVSNPKADHGCSCGSSFSVKI